MPSLFGILSSGSSALQTQQAAIEVTGQNIANANNAAYARQRLNVQATSQVDGQFGSVGTGIQGVNIEQLRDSLLDSQVVSEQSVTGSLNSQQTALQNAQAALGQQLDRLSTGSSNSSAVGSTHSLASGMSDLFNAFQTLANDPTSASARQNVVLTAQTLAGQFSQVESRFSDANTALNQSVSNDVQSANQLMSDIAGLNNTIANAEASNPGSANDLRDLRQQKLESLSNLVKFDTSKGPNGAVNIVVGGVTMITGGAISDSLKTVDPGNGKLLVQAATAGTTLNITSGTVGGTIDARDGAIASAENQINSLAAGIIKEVNAVHATGFSQNGTTGNAFFTGTGAGDMAVNTVIANNPTLIQASGDPTSVGNNKVALAIAKMSSQSFASLGGQTVTDNYGATVAALGSALNKVNSQISDQTVVAQMLQTQRDSASGVSLDEEMTNLTRFQRAYQASARVITTIDTMFDSVLALKA